MANNVKMRVWWVTQIPMDAFYVPVSSVEEAKKVMDLLAYYDLWQLNNNVKPDFCNAGGLQVWDEEAKEWYDWDMETEDDYFDNVDEYCQQCPQAEELAAFTEALIKQVL